jgi:hypothetical protein
MQTKSQNPRNLFAHHWLRWLRLAKTYLYPGMLIMLVATSAAAQSSPAIDASFAGVPLQPNTTLTHAGQFVVQAQSATGIASISVQLNGMTVFSYSYANLQTATLSEFIDFAPLANGTYMLGIIATDANSVSSQLQLPFTLTMSMPAIAVITTPADNATVSLPVVQVSGAADSGSQIQLYVNGMASGSPVIAINGAFGASITLPSQGSHLIQARASNARGSSVLSEGVTVHYQTAVPAIAFATPAEGAHFITAANISVPVTVTASALDGIVQVQILADDQLLATLTETPYTAQWAIGGLAAGAHTLRAVARAASGREASVTRNVTLENAAPPAPPPTPYTGQVQTISPTNSFGESPITIAGQAISRETGQPVPNAVLRLLLKINGFERRINLASDAQGAFSYQFITQSSDSGSYQVAVQHPQENGFTAQGSFSINRLNFSPAGANLMVARDFPTQFSITAHASAGDGASGVRWTAQAASQPGGSLPPGIHIDTGAAMDVPAGASAPSLITFTPNASANTSGTVVLTAYANESGNTPRGNFTINYQITNAAPSLYAEPALIQTGVQQGSSVSEQTAIGNRGLVAAQNVRLHLVDSQGNNPPDWLFLSSSSTLGAIDVGARVPIQITASPTTNIADGIYNYRILVDADNQAQGAIPVSVAVTQSGQGGVIFSVSDLFTDTLDASGNLIEGVAGARIRLQNEAVPTEIHTLTTTASGRVELTGIPPGAYVYRATGPRHSDKSGRIFVRPGIAIREHIHLSYQSVSVEFSVTETTIQDHYDIVLQATYQTQVPAPVVLLEPMAVNLPDLQIGEEYTGELTLTNYGLIEARNVKFNPPQSDEYYRYEFLANVPQTLPAKTRITIAYRITALKAQPQSMSMRRSPGQASNLGQLQKNTFDRLGAKASGGNCTSYSAQATSQYEWDCINGWQETGATSSTFSRLVGSDCGSPDAASSAWNSNSSSSSGGGGSGGWGSLGGGTSSPIPLTPGCTPHCAGKCCRYVGAGG